ncbi:putative toxin-antitoxin system toxin component, PIN family [Mucilaginibacter sp. UR6-1]|uniref:putative toxin-antitoxin system toxin component, PIN family n=1 Tax=Mucilaginibacter sp. UR6-1 TaxID=1435643 RepID=UPI001E33581C|nr:putative toxin-antitoxin system toxin component, PIN family [Mucilaginibacter sp. UR6-1]MCC8410802.1 putative toxin-antitoxin system toxin component, PIN family [Mucilaginibacter sp. UR6-1]
MKSKPVRIILDTNLWVSFLITKNYSKLDDLLFKHKVILIFSEELLSEFTEVINRPKLRRYFSNTGIDDLLEVINEYAEIITVITEVDLCRDEKDNFLLALAVDAQADYLVTGDNDLLTIKQIKNTTILTIADLFKSL